MPFSDTEHLRDGHAVKTTVAEWNHIYENWIKKAVESFKPYKFQCLRSASVPGNFIKGIVHDLYANEIVIADLTGSRSNVYYELGIRHALETGTIMITQDLNAVPSDLKSYYCFAYKYASEHHEYESHYKKFEEELHRKMAHFFENPGISDNPVSDFIGHKNAFLEERFQREKSELTFLMETFFNVVDRNFTLCEELLKLSSGGAPSGEETGEIMVFDFFPFDLLLTRFVNTRWEMMPVALLENIYNALDTYRRLFLPIHQGWQILRINPDSPVGRGFFALVEATTRARQEDFEKLRQEALLACKNLSYTISYESKSTDPKPRSGT